MKISYLALLLTGSLTLASCANHERPPRPKPGSLEYVTRYCEELTRSPYNQKHSYLRKDENEVVRYSIPDVPGPNFSECMDTHWNPAGVEVEE